jgi:hypothetical protein
LGAEGLSVVAGGGIDWGMKEDEDVKKERPLVRERRAQVTKESEEFVSPVNRPSVKKEEEGGGDGGGGPGEAGDDRGEGVTR